MQHGYLKNFCLASVPLLIKDKLMQTFSKAHIGKPLLCVVNKG